jgi:hypothetical protein
MGNPTESSEYHELADELEAAAQTGGYTLSITAPDIATLEEYGEYVLRQLGEGHTSEYEDARMFWSVETREALG